MRRAAVIEQGDSTVIPPGCSVGRYAACWGCGTRLAAFGWDAAGGRAKLTFIAMSLVQRPSAHVSGVPRYGPVRRSGHSGSRHEAVDPRPFSWRGAIALPEFYANCPSCDRGQLVASPDIASADIGVLISG